MTPKAAADALDPVAVAAGEGEAWWWLGGLAEIKLSAEQSGGAISIVEITEPPGAEAPLHVHHREDEGFWILEGSATFEVAGTTVEAAPGDFLFGPRDVPHRYVVGDSGCRMLFVLTPGGFEGMIRAMSRPATERTLPPAEEEPPDMSGMDEVFASYGCEIVG